MLARLVLVMASVALVACSGKAPTSKNQLAAADPKQKEAPKADPEGDAPQTPSGDPQPAPEESQNAPPRPDGGAPKDAGPSARDRDPKNPQDPQDPAPSDPPYDPALDPDSCWSATLLEFEEPGACVQSGTTTKWYQCHATQWFQGVTGTTGPYGECTSLHPL